MTIGTRLRNWRKSNKKTTTEICKETGISAGALSNYENDKREISSEFLLKLEKNYNVDIYYILTGVKKDRLTEEEKEILKYFRLLPDKEKYRELGRLEEKAEQYHPLEKSSDSKIG